MQINRYRLKESITENDILKLGARQGGDFVCKDAKLIIYHDLTGSDDVSINIAFKNDIHDWNDYDNIDILDDNFGQPYTPFYECLDKKLEYQFDFLARVVMKYNEYMDSLGIFEKI